MLVLYLCNKNRTNSSHRAEAWGVTVTNDANPNPETSDIDRSLHGRVALVSGGTGDIGHAITRELLRRGATVALSDLHPDDNSAVYSQAQALTREFSSHTFCYSRVDVTDRSSVRDWVHRIASRFGTPTIVVPNAGIDGRASLTDISEQRWRSILSVNLDGAMNLACEGAAVMLKAQALGHIIFIGSVAAHLPSAVIPAYCVSKAGLRMLCKCMALELGPKGIRVNEVAPGNVEGGMSGRIFESQPELIEQTIHATPLRALVGLDDVALAVANLCDPSFTRAITGTTVIVDGGLSLRGAS